MAGMKFEYDENGGKFYYFLLSFYALVVIPCTYYFWPKSEKKSNNQKLKFLFKFMLFFIDFKMINHTQKIHQCLNHVALNINYCTLMNHAKKEYKL